MPAWVGKSDEEVRTEIMKAAAEYNVPAGTREGLARYLMYGVPTGDFLLAVLSNDLRDAVGRADMENQRGLVYIVNFLYNVAPSAAWGSPDKVAAWRDKRGFFERFGPRIPGGNEFKDEGSISG